MKTQSFVHEQHVLCHVVNYIAIKLNNVNREIIGKG